MTAAATGLGGRLIFVISAPRSGSTLLMRILNATSGVVGVPEPHLIPPLAHAGPWRCVDQAPYDPVRAQQAQRGFVAALPAGEADYFDACRAYTDTLYGRMLAQPGGGASYRSARYPSASYLVDKTPQNALVLPFVTRLYPDARYVVLTRHPAAIFASYADSFFDGDYAAAARFNPILSRYIPPIASLLQRPPAHLLHLSYRQLVTAPEVSLRSLSTFLKIPFEVEALHYQRASVAPGPGDPLGVARHERPVSEGLDRWVSALAADSDRFDVVARQLAGVSAEDLMAWGTPRDQLWAALHKHDATSTGGVQAGPGRQRRWQRYLLQRRVLLWLRRDIDRRPHGAVVRRIRQACDVLLRGS